MTGKTPDELVNGYLAALGVVVRALTLSTEGVSRPELGSPLTAVMLDDARVRSGRIEGVGTFRLHGTGCAFELESGEEVDFDWDLEARVVFDPWRIRRYARSVGEMDTVEETLIEALRSLVHRGVLEAVGHGWYSIAYKRPRGGSISTR